MRRRVFLKSAPAVGIAALAGCPDDGGEADESTTAETQTSASTATTIQETATQETTTRETTTQEPRDATFELRNLSAPTSVERGNEVRISVDIRNMGEQVGETTVEITIGSLTCSTTVELAPGESQTVTCSEQLRITEGSYEVTVTESATSASVVGELVVDPLVFDLPWSQLPGPPGGPVTDIAVSPVDDDYIYTATQTAGLYASSDGGESWIQGPEARHHERRIVASPHDPATARTSFNRTTTAGRRWYDSNDPQQLRRTPDIDAGLNRMGYDPTEEDIRYVGTTDGLYRSADGGISWEKVDIDVRTEDDTVSWVDAPPDGDGIVYVAYYADATVVRSDDYGESWEVVVGPDEIPAGKMRGLVAERTGAAAYVCVSDRGVYRVGDGAPELLGPEPSKSRGPIFLFYDGPTLSADDQRLYFHAFSLAEDEDASDMWETMQLYEYDTTADAMRTVDVPENHASITAHPNDPDTLYFGGWSWVWESTDRGETWTSLSNSFIDRYLSAVCVNRSRPNTVIPGSICSSGVWVSQDGGETFAWKRSGLEPFHQDGEFAEHYVLYTRALGQYAYATTRAGLLISEDGGETWRLLDTDFSGSGGVQGEDPTPLHGLAVDPTDPRTVYVGAGRIGHATTTPADFGDSLVWKTIDGGRSWRDITNDLPGTRDTVVGQILVSQHTPSVVYVASSKKDKFIPDGSDEPKVGEGIGLYRSPDGGSSWGRVPTPFSSMFNIAEDATDGDQLYASTQMGVYRTMNGGETWEKVLPHKTKALVAHPEVPGIVIAGSNKYENYWDLLVSTDGGDSWGEGNLTIQVGREPDEREYDGIDLNADYRPDFGYIMDIAVAGTDNSVYAATRGAGLWRGTVEDLIEEQ